MNWGMVPDWVGFQFGRYGVSLSLSFLSLRHWSTSSSQLFAGSLKPACFSMGSLYMRMNVLVKYGRPMTAFPSLLRRPSRLAGLIFFLSSSIPGSSSRPRIIPLSYQRSRLLWVQYITSTVSPPKARVSRLGWYCGHGTVSYFTSPENFWLYRFT